MQYDPNLLPLRDFSYRIRKSEGAVRAIIIESSKSEYRNIRLSDIRISAKSYIRVGPYYP